MGVMRIQSELCHIDEFRVVVRISAWDNDSSLGSSLGEGSTTELAEENAEAILEAIKVNANRKAEA